MRSRVTQKLFQFTFWLLQNFNETAIVIVLDVNLLPVPYEVKGQRGEVLVCNDNTSEAIFNLFLITKVLQLDDLAIVKHVSYSTLYGCLSEASIDSEVVVGCYQLQISLHVVSSFGMVQVRPDKVSKRNSASFPDEFRYDFSSPLKFLYKFLHHVRTTISNFRAHAETHPASLSAFYHRKTGRTDSECVMARNNRWFA